MKRKILSILLAVIVILTGLILPDTAEAEETWLWPLDGWGYDCISSSYGYRGLSFNRYHNGIDIGNGNPNGAPVYAMKSGTVTFAGSTTGGYGNQIKISHSGGYESMYAHLNTIEVSKGQSVIRGQRIGTVGNTGRSEGPHLHFEIKLNGNYVNPNPKGQPIRGESLKASNGGSGVAGNISYDSSGYGAVAASIPTNVKATANGKTVRVTWNASKNATKYNVYLVKAPWSWADVKYQGETTSTTYTFNNVANGDWAAFVIARPSSNPDDTYNESKWAEVKVQNHVHSYTTTKYDTAHPHKEFKQCSCGDKQYTGKTKKVDSCETCNPKHEHKFSLKYDTAYPHNEYRICDCGEKQYTGNIRKVDNCDECYPPIQDLIQEEHTHSFSIKYDTSHPHNEYRECSICGEQVYTGNTRKSTGCEICYPQAESQMRELKLQIGIPNMTVDGMEQEIDPGRGTSPIIQNSRTLLPIRAVVESFGAYIVWDGTDDSVTVYAGDTTMQFWIGSTTALVDDEEYQLDVAPVIINSRTFMPLRFIAENMGLTVDWNQKTKMVTVNGMI